MKAADLRARYWRFASDETSLLDLVLAFVQEKGLGPDLVRRLDERAAEETMVVAARRP
jgi:hypothetical protein